MATKKAAKRVAAKKATKSTKRANPNKGTLPRGYKSIVADGDYGSAWDFEAEPELQGTLNAIRGPFTVGKGKDKREKRVAEIEKEDGTKVSVWESAGLKSLFESDDVEEGTEVFIRYEGEKDVGRPQPMRVFTVAIAD